MDILFAVRYPEVSRDLAARLKALAKDMENARTLSDVHLIHNQMLVLTEVIKRQMDQYKIACIKFMEERGSTEECGFHGFDYRSGCAMCNSTRIAA